MLNVLSEHSLDTIKCGIFSLTLFSKLPTNCLSVFDHFVGLALKGLTEYYDAVQEIK